MHGTRRRCGCQEAWCYHDLVVALALLLDFLEFAETIHQDGSVLGSQRVWSRVVARFVPQSPCQLPFRLRHLFSSARLSLPRSLWPVFEKMSPSPRLLIPCLRFLFLDRCALRILVKTFERDALFEQRPLLRQLEMSGDLWGRGSSW